MVAITFGLSSLWCARVNRCVAGWDGWVDCCSCRCCCSGSSGVVVRSVRYGYLWMWGSLLGGRLRVVSQCRRLMIVLRRVLRHKYERNHGALSDTRQRTKRAIIKRRQLLQLSGCDRMDNHRSVKVTGHIVSTQSERDLCARARCASHDAQTPSRRPRRR